MSEDGSTATTPVADVSVHVRAVAADGTDAEAAERELDLARIPLPLSSRPAFLRHIGPPGAIALIAYDAQERCIAMLAMTTTPTRALPGHRVLRIEAVGDSLATPTWDAILREAVRQARLLPRTLRLIVELECRDDSRRDQLASTASGLGFHRIPCERIPDRTLLIDLAPDEDAIFAGLGKSTRQNVRAAARQGFVVEPIDDPALGPRMNHLLALALSRTGGVIHAVDWNAVLRVCAERPDRSRVVGIFRGDSRAPADLLAFAWGLHHGDRVEYHTGASDRVPDIRIRLMSPVLWDLVVWGRRTGGTWFDLGGVTRGSSGSDDALGGISDFKRSFSSVEVAVGQEWALEPDPLKWRVAWMVSRLARWLRLRMRSR